MEDINSGLNAVRKAIESEVAASTVQRRGYYLDAAVLNGNEAIKKIFQRGIGY
jgi:DNA-binding winged helix-turn-helix (wHTH) protein